MTSIRSKIAKQWPLAPWEYIVQWLIVSCNSKDLNNITTRSSVGGFSCAGCPWRFASCCLSASRFIGVDSFKLVDLLVMGIAQDHTGCLDTSLDSS